MRRRSAAWRLPVRAAVAVLVIGAGSLSWTGPAPAQRRTGPVRITFLHVNDTYRIAPVRGAGGLAGLMTLLERERRRGRTITTHGGDLISPSVLSSVTKGRHMIALMNALGLNVAVLGNHEFDHGMAVLRRRMGESRFAWLATNVLDANGRPVGGARAYLVRKVGGVTVGLFGLLTPETARQTRLKTPLAFGATVRTARAAVARLRERGAQVIVALTHLRLARDVDLARRVPGIHLILGGHDHYPVTILAGETLIVKAGSDARHLAVVDLKVHRIKGKTGVRVRVVPSWRLTANYRARPNPRVAAMVKRYLARLDAELNVPVGRTLTALDSRAGAVRRGESAIGNLIADAIRARMGADVGLMNGGGIRGGRTYDAGHTLTRKDVRAELPFDNTLVLLEVTGRQLRQALERGLSRAPRPSGGFPQVSGLRLVYEPSRPPGSRIVRLTVGGEPVDDTRTYRLATNDFLAGGGNRHDMLKSAKRVIGAEAGPNITAAVIAYIKSKRTVAPKIEGRVVAR